MIDLLLSAKGSELRTANGEGVQDHGVVTTAPIIGILKRRVRIAMHHEIDTAREKKVAFFARYDEISLVLFINLLFYQLLNVL